MCSRRLQHLEVVGPREITRVPSGETMVSAGDMLTRMDFVLRTTQSIFLRRKINLLFSSVFKRSLVWRTDFREAREKVRRLVHRLLQSSKQETDESGSEAQEGGIEDGEMDRLEARYGWW